jgi:hypothetical protein
MDDIVIAIVTGLSTLALYSVYSYGYRAGWNDNEEQMRNSLEMFRRGIRYANANNTVSSDEFDALADTVDADVYDWNDVAFNASDTNTIDVMVPTHDT